MAHRHYDRTAWRATQPDAPPLSPAQQAQLYAVAPGLPDGEIEAIYVPLTARLQHLIEGQPRPFMIGIAGSVAAGKSTVARLLQVLLIEWAGLPTVQIVSTDGFLYPTATLEARGLMHRKGFPESYDAALLLHTLQGVRAGEYHEAPIYSHRTYDRLPNTTTAIQQPDVLIVEGINVLQPLPEHPEGIRPFLDITLYVDAEEDTLFRWFRSRFQALLEAAKDDPSAYLHPFSTMTPTEVKARATHIWTSVNLLNLREHIRPTRQYADLILAKSANHRVTTVSLREPSQGHA
ncbi:MAG: type I pantothenate kinase [Rhodothermales bacterium]